MAAWRILFEGSRDVALVIGYDMNEIFGALGDVLVWGGWSDFPFHIARFAC